ncbi:hypothetical protein [Thermococcus sp.]
METIKPEDCFEKVHLLWDFVEKRSDLYRNALNAGEKIKKGSTSGIEDLVEFLRGWNKARRYDEETLKQQLNCHYVRV